MFPTYIYINEIIFVGIQKYNSVIINIIQWQWDHINNYHDLNEVLKRLYVV